MNRPESPIRAAQTQARIGRVIARLPELSRLGTPDEGAGSALRAAVVRYWAGPLASVTVVE